MSTIYRLVTWDTLEDEEDYRPIAVWTCSANKVALGSRGVWENVFGQYATEGLEEEYTPEEFRDHFGLDINNYCRPGGSFTLRGEVSWFCQAADRRMI